MTTFRGARRYRSPYGRRSSSPGAVAGLALGTALAVSAGAHAVTSAHAKAHPAHVTAVTGGSEAAFIAAVLADLGAPGTTANQQSMTAWGAREGCWGCTGRNNQWDTTLAEPGSTWFNTFYSNGVALHVQNYPTAIEGADATAVTLEEGYPQITAALRSGAGLCGDPNIAGELLTWSGNGYGEVC